MSLRPLGNSALRDINLEVERGTVHALIGENGAGKSTALGAVAGRTAIDTGVIEVHGEALPSGNLRAARRAGVAAIYQELTIVPGLTADANVFLGQPIARAGMLSARAMRKRYEDLCETTGVTPIGRRVLAGTLSVAEQQLLEIMRALIADPRVILFDEPSQSLALPEREALYRVIEGLQRRGVTVVFVSHNLEEVERLADRVTVFRDGRLVVTSERGGLSRSELVHRMLGEQSETGAALVAAMGAGTSTVATARRHRALSAPGHTLRAVNVTVPKSIEGVDVELRGGEILGIAGLVGIRPYDVVAVACWR